MEIQKDLIVAFRQHFSHEPSHGLFSPGRVNLIGEHIDYCGGHVMPMAINLGTSAVFSRNNTSSVRIYSSRFKEEVQVTPNDILSGRTNHWRDYVTGVFRVLGHRSIADGFDIYVDDDIPSGGLSSSASFSIAMAIAARSIVSDHPLEIDNVGERIHLALMCQRAENDFVGVSCGVMDQVSILIGGIIKLNCSTLAHKTVHHNFENHSIVVMDTGKERTLASSIYNERVAEVNAIFERLREHYNIRHLAQLEPQLLAEATQKLEGELPAKRLRHVVTEEQRVLKASEAMQSGDMSGLGQLMNESHESLAKDYEVTGDELDVITKLSRGCPGVSGSRMTGAGFGGCAISLVAHDEITDHNKRVGEDYFKETGLQAGFYQVEMNQGAAYWSL